MLYTSGLTGMAGCCSGSDTEDCGWYSRCVASSAYAAGVCGPECQANDYVRKCTAASAPFCVTSTYPGNQVADYGCDASSTNTVYTVLQRATDSAGRSTSISLPTVSGSAITGIRTASRTGVVSASRTSRYAATGGSSFGEGSDSSGARRKAVRTVAVGLIVGVVAAALTVVFFIVICICMCVKKKKKQRKLAADAQSVAAMQANRPQSMYPGPPSQQQYQPLQQGPPPMLQGVYMAPVAPQSPPPPASGYFAPPGQDDQKYNPHHSVHEYAVSAISNPASPAPGTVQPGSIQGVPSPMLSQTSMHAQYPSPVNGAHEADSTGIGRPPAPLQPEVPHGRQDANAGVGAHEVDAGSVPPVPANGKPVYEMGEGK